METEIHIRKPVVSCPAARLCELLHEMREKIQTEDDRQEGFKSGVTES